MRRITLLCLGILGSAVILVQIGILGMLLDLEGAVSPWLAYGIGFLALPLVMGVYYSIFLVMEDEDPWRD